jgi:tetratricopeptide (TPR) repeat protein
MSRFTKLEFESGAENDRELKAQPSHAPRDGAFYLRDAQTAWEEGDFERALRSYARVLEDTPGNPVPWTGQVRMLIELEEFREAKLWADKALEQFPREPDLLAAKAVALARTGDPQAALAFSDASFEERGDTSWLWIARADVLFAREEARADYCIERAIGLDPSNWFVRWLIARVQFYYGRFVLSLKAVQAALALDASRAVLWLQLGLCQRQLGLIPAAADSITHALQLSPKNAMANAAMTSVSETGPLSRLRGRLRHLFSK